MSLKADGFRNVISSAHKNLYLWDENTWSIYITQPISGKNLSNYNTVMYGHNIFLNSQ